MIRADEIDVLEAEASCMVALPMATLQKLLKTKDDEKTIKWLCDNEGTFFHLSSYYEPVEVVKKYLIETTEKGKVVHEVVEFRTKSSLQSDRYLMRHELTCEEYVSKRCKEEGLTGSSMISRFAEFTEEWQKTLA